MVAFKKRDTGNKNETVDETKTYTLNMYTRYTHGDSCTPIHTIHNHLHVRPGEEKENVYMNGLILMMLMQWCCY